MPTDVKRYFAWFPKAHWSPGHGYNLTICRVTRSNLIKSKQLTSLKNGVYKREGSSVAWGDVVYFLQRNDATDLTIGGITALQLLKLSHYLSFSDKRVVQLYGQDPLPTWINRVTDDSFFQKGNASDLLGRATDPLLAKQLNQFTRTFDWKDTREGLRISTPRGCLGSTLL